MKFFDEFVAGVRRCLPGASIRAAESLACGLEFLKKGRQAEALAAFDRALLLNPCNDAALNQRANALLALALPFSHKYC